MKLFYLFIYLFKVKLKKSMIKKAKLVFFFNLGGKGIKKALHDVYPSNQRFVSGAQQGLTSFFNKFMLHLNKN